MGKIKSSTSGIVFFPPTGTGDVTLSLHTWTWQQGNVRNFTVVGNGVHDDSHGIQRAITSAPTGGAVVLPPGIYKLGGNGAAVDGALLPRSDVRIYGSGVGLTVLKMTTLAPAFYGQFTTTAPCVNFTLAHLTITGATQPGSTYNVAYKGVFMQYLATCTFEDLVVQTCIATGLGIDFLTKGTLITNVRAIGNGRLNHGGVGGGGGAGIGIGTGQHTVEAFTINNCYAYGNGRYGIFIESQTGLTSKGICVSNSTSESNFQYGFGDAGGTATHWANCHAINNTLDGFSLDNGTVGVTAIPGGNTLFTGCTAEGNLRYGFSYGPLSVNTTNPTGAAGAAGAGNIKFVGCKAIANSSIGFSCQSLTGHPVNGFFVTECESYKNGASGVRAWTHPSKNVVVSGGQHHNNGQTSAGSHFGIEFAIAVTGGKIHGTKCWDDGSVQKQTHGFNVGSGVTVTGVHISENTWTGNKTAAVQLLGTLTTCVVRGTLGYNPHAVTAPAFPATTVTYTNGLSVDVMAYITNGTGAMTTTINGKAGPAIAATAKVIGVPIPALSTFKPTYSAGTPTWVFVGN